MINRTQVYYYMGNIAAQIDAITERAKNPTLPPFKTIGLLRMYSPQELINFHWRRITVLERCLQIPEEVVRQEMTDIYNSICTFCKQGIDHTLPESHQFPCPGDFWDVCKYSLHATALLPEVK